MSHSLGKWARRNFPFGLCLLILPCRSSVVSRMDKCTKFKIFNVTLIFCVFNFFLYRFFAYPGANPFLISTKSNHANSEGHGLANSFFHSTDDRLTSSRHLDARKSEGPKGNANDKPESPENPSKASQQKFPPNQNNSKTPSETHSDTSKANSNTSVIKAKVDDVKLPTTPKPPLSSKLGQAKDNSSQKAGDTDEKTSGESQGALPLCPLLPPNLMGPLATFTESISFEKVAEMNPLLKPGGKYKPSECVARHRVAIVIPYRNREQHLKILLHNIHPMLQRQQLDYGVFVIEQALPTRFNRAMLMNIGYVEALKRYDYQCAIFHDVDLIPENDRNIYSCPQMPRHLSAAIDKFQYRLPYAAIYGGVSAMTKEHMRKVNGFSNLFFGWGGEDDDMAARIKAKGLKISRYPMSVARYRMIKHSSKERGNEPNPQRYALLKNTGERMDRDGLNTLHYIVKKVDEFPTYTNILVYIDENDYKT